ncbi:hypothetical protein Drorol1_Dr00000732 [Drosera rotundifolia]
MANISASCCCKSMAPPSTTVYGHENATVIRVVDLRMPKRRSKFAVSASKSADIRLSSVDINYLNNICFLVLLVLLACRFMGFDDRSLTMNSMMEYVQVSKSCKTCRGKGAIECPGCKGTGKNKKNGNIFERWKCFDCQGFGLKSCPICGQGGLTPEQRGER